MPEVDIYIAKDGHQYILNSATSRDRVILSEDGTGMPPIDYVTERGPYQHGETVHDFWLRPRIIQLLIRQNFCSREEYWNGRHILLDAIRPNRGLVGTLRKVWSNGIKRDLDVTIQEGPRFEPRNLTAWDERAIQETLRFVAHNPIYYDPDTKSIDFVPRVCPEFTYTFPLEFCDLSLIFPFTLPFSFSEAFNVDAVIIYNGTWIEYPTFEITGRMTGLLIENLTTNEKIEFRGMTIASGETARIELTFGTKTAFKSDGTNLLPFLTPDSNLNDFHLTMGENVLHARATFSDLSTHLRITWRERFIGI
jgi:hypothetical protein